MKRRTIKTKLSSWHLLAIETALEKSGTEVMNPQDRDALLKLISSATEVVCIIKTKESQ